MEVSAPPVPRLFARTPLRHQRVGARAVRTLRLPSAAAPGLGLDGRPGPAHLARHAGRQRGSVRAAVRNRSPRRSWRTRTNPRCAMATRRAGASRSCARRAGRAAPGCGRPVSVDALYYHVDPSRGHRGGQDIVRRRQRQPCSWSATASSPTNAWLANLTVNWSCASAGSINGATSSNAQPGQPKLTQWCRRWIERIASIYRLNEDRQVHYDPALRRQSPSFDAAQHALNAALRTCSRRPNGSWTAWRPTPARPSRCARCCATARG